jgi:NOL1/NOP2/fmu family ribosome biogenesis protein
MKPLTSTDKKRIIEKLNEQFGIINIPGLIILFGKEKLRLYSGNLLKEELYYLDNELNMENIGLYFAKYENDEIRLTIEGVQFFKDHISKNIIELNNQQTLEWFKGNDLDIKTSYGWKILKYKNEFIGCGKSTAQKISNFMPKERRIKN